MNKIKLDQIVFEKVDHLKVITKIKNILIFFFYIQKFIYIIYQDNII